MEHTLEIIGTVVGILYLWLEYRASIYLWIAYISKVTGIPIVDLAARIIMGETIKGMALAMTR